MITVKQESPISVIGGKAFNLFKMMRGGLKVPETMVLSTDEVQQIILNQEVTTQSVNEVLQAFPGVELFSVRSSGVGEDGEFLSWAGQFLSMLDVPREQVPAAILACANAQKSESTTSYAKRNSAEIPALALIVQPMIQAQFAGVIFTFDPTSGSDSTVIELIDGCGESLVSGQKAGERIFVDSSSGEIISREGESYGISRQDIEKLTSLSREIKALFGVDQDIEFCDRSKDWYAVRPAKQKHHIATTEGG